MSSLLKVSTATPAGVGILIPPMAMIAGTGLYRLMQSNGDGERNRFSGVRDVYGQCISGIGTSDAGRFAWEGPKLVTLE